MHQKSPSAGPPFIHALVLAGTLVVLLSGCGAIDQMGVPVPIENTDTPPSSNDEAGVTVTDPASTQCEELSILQESDREALTDARIWAFIDYYKEHCETQ